ncbi:DUF456 domain-containing protein [Klebsiella michiganensis]|uniref:DUF456 domain-containing protein n=1 Tax=Klebsiella michiganensis TaxID=1134687 RepID=UPI0015ABC320|nr:DUF456 domain-containing protein [Klebsiella michiganensis]HCF6467176.1 hypothetical protein [Klebsiella oxytoca]HCF8164324.1 hypothetical protein [Klebsiella oxytoca]
MANIKVHYANFPYQEITTGFGVISIKTSALQIKGEVITGDKLLSLEICTENNVKRIGGALGWGVVGGMLAGPAGIIAGAFLGGNKKDVTFIAEMKDGRKFMGTTDSKAYTDLTASKLKFDDILNVSLDDDESEYIPTYDEEMMIKANRMYNEPDYMAWKERTGEAEVVRAWMVKTGYYPPGYHE